MYKLDNGKVNTTTYDMFPGLNNCMFIEYVEPEEVKSKIPESSEPSFTFFDDRVDYMLKKNAHEKQMNKYNKDYVPKHDSEYLGMTRKQWNRFDLCDRCGDVKLD